jgi:multisubunit Na+/H+ antiporter MnhE subunit
MFAVSAPGNTTRVADDQGPSATGANGPPGGEPRRQRDDIAVVRRVGSWLVWWALLMGLWVAVDDNIGLAELGAGAGAAALGAFVAEVAGYQASTRFRMRIEWIVPAFRLPGQVISDTVIVFRALWRLCAHGEQPPSGFRELPVRFGDDSDDGVTRRVLLVGANSLAPNTFVLDIDADRDAMVVHQLVVNRGRPAS